MSLNSPRNVVNLQQPSQDYFLSNLSHQIRTPLNGIVGYTQLLSQTKLNKNQQSYITSINTCSLQLISLINDILDFSKLTTGKAQIKKECFSVREIVQEINSALGGRIKEKKQKIHYVLDTHLPTYIISDKLKISQILINLISNANKFSPINSRIIVNITPESSDSPISKDTLKFHIEDSGIGISPSDQKKLFNPFVQIQDSLTKNGSGLGLAICKKLVELLGGEISVQSIKDNGTIFTFTIKYESYEEFKTFIETKNHLIKDKTILILDSDIDTRINLAEILFDSGLKPIVCSSYKELFKILESKRYSFSSIISEISLSDISASQLFKQIKEIDPEIPIIALSQLDDTLDCINFDKIIYKPINRIKILDALQQVINKHNISNFQLKESENLETKVEVSPREVSPREVSRREKLEPIIPSEIKILVAEDVSYNLEMLVKMLNTMGYNNVDSAIDGEDAISKISKSEYNIIILDLKMPKKNGFEVAEYIKNSHLNCSVAVLSASILDSDRDRCRELGIKFFLLKPFSMTNLKIIMNRMISNNLKP